MIGEISTRSLIGAKGSLVFLKIDDGMLGEKIKILYEKEEIYAQIIFASKTFSIAQIFGDISGFDLTNTRVIRYEDLFKFKVGDELIGRTFNAIGEPIDNGPDVWKGEYKEINGLPINPIKRRKPDQFIETGISAIDGLNSLVKGQKLPIFSINGLPHYKIVVDLTNNISKDKIVVLGLIGVTNEDANYLINNINGEEIISFVNTSDKPSINRLILPRIALTTAEYFAYEKNKDVVVILADMTNYCESLREVASARNELLSRKGYPGYMYSDLASIYERAGDLGNGSITQIPVLTMPEGDITNPVPDLTGYITEGQIVLSQQLYAKGVYPPIDPVMSLSRLMNDGIGKGKTREDHKIIANKLISLYAKGLDARSLAEIIGKNALSDEEKKYEKFATDFEFKFINQNEKRSIEETLNIGWSLLNELGKEATIDIDESILNKYGKQISDSTA